MGPPSALSAALLILVSVCVSGRTATTLCCRQVALLVAHPIVAQYVPNTNIPEKPFLFSLTAPPFNTVPLEVAIAVSSVPCGGGGGLLQTKPQSGSLAYAVPSAFQFQFPSTADPSTAAAATAPPPQLERIFFLRSGSTGCFNITISGQVCEIPPVLSIGVTPVVLGLYWLQVRATPLRQRRCMSATSASPLSALP